MGTNDKANKQLKIYIIDTMEKTMHDAIKQMFNKFKDDPDAFFEQLKEIPGGEKLIADATPENKTLLDYINKESDPGCDLSKGIIGGFIPDCEPGVLKHGKLNNSFIEIKQDFKNKINGVK